MRLSLRNGAVMKFLRFLEGLRNPVCDFLFSAITHLGEETAFLVVAILIFWCVNKRSGYYIMTTGFFGMMINQTLKLLFKIPRPWIQDRRFTIVESAREGASGYSFPSGHTQMAVGTFGAIALTARKRWLFITAIAIAALVSFSRMYLGVHTPWDVLASVGIGIIILLLLEPVFSSKKRFKKVMPYILLGLCACAVGFFVYARIAYGKNPTDVNFESGLQNACMLLGCAAGFVLTYILDSKFIRFKTEAKWYSQIMKLVFGIALVILIKELLKLALVGWLGVYYERILRYFVVVAFAGCVWPLSFSFFSKLEIPALDRFAEKVKSFFARKKKNDTGEA